MTLNSFLSKFKGGQQRPPFVAPVTPSTKRVFTLVDGLPYHYQRLRRIPNAWNRFKFNRSGILEIDHGNPPQPYEIRSYLELLRPRWAMIVLYKLGDGSFLCYPFNAGDAKQKGWGDGPVAVHLVTDTVEPFDVVYARGVIYNLIYDMPSAINIANKDVLLNILGKVVSYSNSDKFNTGESRTAFNIVNSRLIDIQRSEVEQARVAQTLTMEGRIKYNLEFLGAELLSWRESGNDIVVTWKDGGQTYNSRIDSKMGTVSAGICLSGKDSDFNVAAMVDVIRQARKENKVVRVGNGGMSEESYRRAHPNGGENYEDEYDDDD